MGYITHFIIIIIKVFVSWLFWFNVLEQNSVFEKPLDKYLLSL